MSQPIKRRSVHVKQNNFFDTPLSSPTSATTLGGFSGEARGAFTTPNEERSPAVSAAPLSIMRRMTMFHQAADGSGTQSASQLGLLPCKVRYHESPLNLRLFMVEGLLTQVFFPLAVVYHLLGNRGLEAKSIKHLLLPLGTWWCLSPLLWVAAAGVVVSALLLLSHPDWSNDVYLRQQGDDVNMLGIGEGAVAISFWVLTAVCSAIATSHKPLLLEGKRMLPFSEELKTTTMVSAHQQLRIFPDASTASPTSAQGLGDSDHISAGATPLSPESKPIVTFLDPPEGDKEGSSPLKKVQYSPKSANAPSPSRSPLHLLKIEAPEPEPPSNKATHPSLLPSKSELSLDIRPRHIPYDQVLYDEVPPIEDDVMLLYSCSEFFEANREMEPTLHEEQERVLQGNTEIVGPGNVEQYSSSSPSKSAPANGKSGGRFSPKGQGTTGRGVQERSSYTFKFVIGEVVRRSALEPEVEFIFGGEIGTADEGTAVEIASRKWGPGGIQLYAVDNAAPGRWYVMNDHFTGSGTNGRLYAMDVAVGSEGFFASLSHRAEMRRFDLCNGNYSSLQGVPSPLHPLARLLMISVCLCISFCPILVRWFTGQPVQGQGSVAEWIMVTCSLALNFICAMSVCTVARSCRLSLSNFAAVADAFSTVCFNTHRNRWFPLLNLLEPVNVEAWYFLRMHLLSVHPHAFQGRCLMCVALVSFTFSWGAYGMTYIALSPDATMVLFEGWLIGALAFCVVLSINAAKSLYHAAVVNSEFKRHLSYLSLTKVMTAEEICSEAGSRRDNGDIATLIDAQAILADVMFVLGNTADPIAPLGISLTFSIWGFVCLTQLLLLIPLGFTVTSFVQTNERWFLPDLSMLL